MGKRDGVLDKRKNRSRQAMDIWEKEERRNMKFPEKQERNSSLELLRIIGMMAIIGLHYFNGNMGGAATYVLSTGKLFCTY